MLIAHADLLNLLDVAELDHDQLRTDYSGRGMYGKTCVGLVGSFTDLAKFVYACGQLDTEAFADDSDDDTGNDGDRYHRAFVRNGMATDSMGYDSIFYWSHVQCMADESSSDED